MSEDRPSYKATCWWCGNNAPFILSHVCPDGSTFEQRMQYRLENRTSPIDTPKPVYGEKWQKDYNAIEWTAYDREILRIYKVKP